MLRHWPLVVADFLSEFHVDLAQPGLLDERSWEWLNNLVKVLVSTPTTRIARRTIQNSDDG